MSVPVTILMAQYNGMPYLIKTLESLLSQTYTDFEILIIDDCSQDESRSYLSSIKDSRLKVHFNKQNIGQTRSLNLGLELSNSNYIMRMDADDYAFPAWVENQLNAISANPEYTVVSCRAVAMDMNNRIFKLLNTPQDYNEILMHSLLHSPINHVGSIFRKSEVLAVGGYDASYTIAADYALWSELLKAGHKIKTDKRVGVAVRLHDASISKVEHEKLGLKEISRIMHSNIRDLCGEDLNKEEVVGIWRLMYDHESLTVNDFLKTSAKLTDLLGVFCQRQGFSQSVSAGIIGSIQNQLFVKMLISLSAQKNNDEMKSLSEKFRSRYKLFPMIKLADFFVRRGPIFIKEHFFQLFRNLRTIEAVLTLKGQRYVP